MSYQIDQSGKIEQTNKNTVIAYANSSRRAILIKAKVKRQLQEVFRLCGFTRLYTYYVFSVGIFYLIAHLTRKTQFTIDIEYPGKDIMISQLIEKLLHAHNKPLHSIRFARIGNRPSVHYAAKDVFDGKMKADIVATFTQMLREIKKTDGRLRECLATLVDARPRSIRKSIPNKTKKSTERKPKKLG